MQTERRWVAHLHISQAVHWGIASRRTRLNLVAAVPMPICTLFIPSPCATNKIVALTRVKDRSVAERVRAGMRTRVSNTRLCVLTSEWMLVVSCRRARSGQACLQSYLSFLGVQLSSQTGLPAAAGARGLRAHQCLCCSRAPATPGRSQPVAGPLSAYAYITHVKNKRPAKRASGQRQRSHLRWPCPAEQRAPRPAIWQPLRCKGLMVTACDMR